jgi:cytochrome c biogenesis protein CcmG/thiol:disulfide interchange protein DsbE
MSTKKPNPVHSGWNLGFMLVFMVAAFTTQAQQLGEASGIPDAELETLTGSEVELDEQLADDKYTIISFWATWCKPCKKELSNLNYLMPEWKKQFDVELLAISLDNAQTSRKVESYVNGKGWQFDVLLDPNNNTKRKLNFNAIPYSIIVDKEGKIIYKHSGYKSGDEYEMKDKLKEVQMSGESG